MSTRETEAVVRWLERAVIGLGLCPFAGESWREGRIRMVVSQATSEAELTATLRSEVKVLAAADPQSVETTIVIVPHMLHDFLDYNQFLDRADAVLEEGNWSGIFQIASFHPYYQFAGTQPDDVSNLTNRSPYPLLHILRESSVSRAVETHPNAAQIPADNIRILETLDGQRRREIFEPPPEA